MNNKQIWQTIALDLKRAASLLHVKRDRQASFFLDEAKRLYNDQKLNGEMSKLGKFIKFDGNPEDILLGSSLIMSRV